MLDKLEDLSFFKIMLGIGAIILSSMFLHKYSIIQEESESFRKLQQRLIVCEAIGKGRCTFEALTDEERKRLRQKRNETRGYYL